MATPIKNKLRNYFNLKKKTVLESIIANRSLPPILQISGTIAFWFIVFVISSILIPQKYLWIPSILSAILAFALMEAMNFIILKVIEKKEYEKEVTEDESLVAQTNLEETLPNFNIKSNTIIKDLNNFPLALLLCYPNKKKIKVIPTVIGVVKEASLNVNSLFSALSFLTKQKLSLKYNCNLVDTAKYEAIVVKGKELIVKSNNLNSALERSISTISEIMKNLNEIAVIAGVNFQPANNELLLELFPLFTEIISINEDKDKASQSPSEENQEEDEHSSNRETVLETKVSPTKTESSRGKSDEEQQTSIVIPDNIDSETKEKIAYVKEFLYNELGYSFSSFFNAIKGYYVKALEREIEEKYEEKPEKILKTAELFFEKKQLPMPFKTYTLFKKYQEFFDIDPPSSTEIEDFINKLSYEYLTVKLSDDTRKELKEFLNSKLKKKVQLENYNGFKPKSSIIPTPPKQAQQEEWGLEQSV